MTESNSNEQKFNVFEVREEIYDLGAQLEDRIESCVRASRRRDETRSSINTKVEALVDAYNTLESDFKAYKHQVEQEHAKLTPQPVGIIAMLKYIASRDKIKAIKECRALTGLGLKEAKDLIDAAVCGAPRPTTLQITPIPPSVRDFANWAHEEGRRIEKKAAEAKTLPGTGSISTPEVGFGNDGPSHHEDEPAQSDDRPYGHWAPNHGP